MMNRYQKGISLIEVVVVMTLISLSLTLALPSFTSFHSKSAITAQLNQLSRAIITARDQAIYLNATVTVCPSNNQFQCQDDWHRGIMSFVDSNHNQIRDNTEQLIFASNDFRQGDTIYWRAFRRKKYLMMSPLGFTAFQNGTFTLCPKEGLEYARGLILNAQGRLRYSADNDGDGIDEGANGQPLRC